ncbi:MAG: hypothetical protein L3K03_02595 [Thermoplasmata archaeon]|nr:hypothetical protein [Thermoplasmata archaeon]
MSELTVEITPAEYARLQTRVLSLYTSVSILMLIGIAIGIVYALSLGTLIGPGVEESFGIDLAILFLMSAMLMHILDRTYREWPEGRRVHPAPPPQITAKTANYTLEIVVIVGAALLIAYVFGPFLA